jgi:hypothetical protein
MIMGLAEERRELRRRVNEMGDRRDWDGCNEAEEAEEKLDEFDRAHPEIRDEIRNLGRPPSPS